MFITDSIDDTLSVASLSVEAINSNNEIWWSELFEPIYKDPCTVPGFEQKYNKQELVSIHKITHPTTVVPDLENTNKRSYLRMVSIKAWSKMFDDWLEEEHERGYE